ncbi:MAG: saccharopine dehydrogenase C-terminal domain-containing protein [bacterium]
MFKIMVLGAGGMGQGACHYLSLHDLVEKFVCYDIFQDNLLKCEQYLGKKGAVQHLDAVDSKKLVRMMAECDGIVNTLPYARIPEITRAAIAAKKSMIDLGGNDEVVAKQKAMHQLAGQAGVTIVPACGLAPGIITDLGFHLQKRFNAEIIAMYCGGLPQEPRGELNHSIFFNVEGLYNEYAEPSLIIRNGRVKEAPPLCPLGDIVFNTPAFNGRLEVALTHGAFDANPNLWKGSQNVFYATLRYPGHFEKVREMIKNLPRGQCVGAFQQKMPTGGKDIIVLQVVAAKMTKKSRNAAIAEIIDFYDEETGLSAMQRCTAFPAAETLLQVLSSKRWPKGVVHHEPYVNMKKMITALSRHNLRVKISAETNGEINT